MPPTLEKGSVPLTLKLAKVPAEIPSSSRTSPDLSHVFLRAGLIGDDKSCLISASRSDLNSRRSSVVNNSAAIISSIK